MSENHGDTPTGNAPSELRDLLAQTLKDQGPDGSSDTAQPAEAPAETGVPPERTQPERGADGRFLSPDEMPPASEGGEEPSPPVAEPPPGPAAVPPALVPPRAPDHWSAEDKELFGSLSSDGDREKFLRLNARREAGLTPKLMRAADLERDGYGELDPLFAPWRGRLREQNRRPGDVIKIWYQVERQLTDKTTQDEVIANLIHGYGADPVNIARHLNARRGFANAQPGSDQPNGGAPPVQGGQTIVTDPNLAARLDRLETSDRWRLEAEQRALASQAAEAYRNFADMRDADGNLAHPFLAEVESQMTALAQLDRAQGKAAIDLQDLYDRAAWQNPSTRERLLATRQESEQRKTAEERKAKADAARRAASSVTGAPGPGAAPQDLRSPERSIRDEIRAQMEGGNRR